MKKKLTFALFLSFTILCSQFLLSCNPQAGGKAEDQARKNMEQNGLHIFEK